jgi:membrane associated rhomboid family serine protease
MSNVGSNNVEKCPLTDETLYCQVSRTAGIAGMVVYILIIIGLVIGVLYAIYYLFFRSGGGSSSGGASGVISKVARKGR